MYELLWVTVESDLMGRESIHYEWVGPPKAVQDAHLPRTLPEVLAAGWEPYAMHPRASTMSGWAQVHGFRRRLVEVPSEGSKVPSKDE